MTTDDALRLAVVLGRRAVAGQGWPEPNPGDLVVEVTQMRVDPDAIGYLIAHDHAPYGADDPLDGSVPMREVWDIRPLNPDAKLQPIAGERLQRWENAQFVALPKAAHDAFASR